MYAVVPNEASDDARVSALRQWFSAAGASMVQGETATNRSVTRPVADNIIALVISPRWDKLSAEGLSEDELSHSSELPV